MLLLGLPVAEYHMDSQMTFVLLTHAHAFKHNHRKHHKYHTSIHDERMTTSRGASFASLA